MLFTVVLCNYYGTVRCSEMSSECLLEGSPNQPPSVVFRARWRWRLLFMSLCPFQLRWMGTYCILLHCKEDIFKRGGALIVWVVRFVPFQVFLCFFFFDKKRWWRGWRPLRLRLLTKDDDTLSASLSSRCGSYSLWPQWLSLRQFLCVTDFPCGRP